MLISCGWKLLMFCKMLQLVWFSKMTVGMYSNGVGGGGKNHLKNIYKANGAPLVSFQVEGDNKTPISHCTCPAHSFQNKIK